MNWLRFGNLIGSETSAQPELFPIRWLRFGESLHLDVNQQTEVPHDRHRELRLHSAEQEVEPPWHHPGSP